MYFIYYLVWQFISYNIQNMLQKFCQLKYKLTQWNPEWSDHYNWQLHSYSDNFIISQKWTTMLIAECKHVQLRSYCKRTKLYIQKLHFIQFSIFLSIWVHSFGRVLKAIRNDWDHTMAEESPRTTYIKTNRTHEFSRRKNDLVSLLLQIHHLFFSFLHYGNVTVPFIYEHDILSLV